MASTSRGLCTFCRSQSRPVIATSSRTFISTSFSTSSAPQQDLETSSSTPASPDPAIIASTSATDPTHRSDPANAVSNGARGSARRRAAIATSRNIPFEQLPYQCFQEARKILSADREEKVQQIVAHRAKIARVKAADAIASGGEATKQMRIRSLEKHLEDLKIWADINDPIIKKRFEDGVGDMNRPIYRHLAKQKWLGRPYRLIMQRVTQMGVVPDYLDKFAPTVSVAHTFGRLRRHKIESGSFVPTYETLHPPKLEIQSFDREEKLVTIAIVDGDVPEHDTDAFRQRCHFLACNIKISPTETFVGLEEALPKSQAVRDILNETMSLPAKARSNPPPVPRAYLSSEMQLVHPYLAPWSSKGAPYHRLTIFVLQQHNNTPLDTQAVLAKQLDRDDFTLRKLLAAHQLSCIGVDMFRTRWDETTDWAMTKIREHTGLLQRIDALSTGQSAQSASEAATKVLAHPPSGSRAANDTTITEQLNQDALVEYKHKRVHPLPLRKKPSYGERFR